MIGAVKSYKMIVKGDDDIAKIQEKHETANKMEDLFSKFRVALPEIKQNKKKVLSDVTFCPFQQLYR